MFDAIVSIFRSFFAQRQHEMLPIPVRSEEKPSQIRRRTR